jgi:1-acyl-sn-glycerol-3-phosphate acyltransferase
VCKQDNEGLLETQRGYPGAIVSNHISYIDILYHMSASYPSFVAKVLKCCLATQTQLF